MKKSFINIIVFLFVVIFSVVEINAQKGLEGEEGGGVNGSVSVSGSQNVYQNEVKTYSVIPSAGLIINNATWLVSGGTIQSQSSFSVTVLWTTIGNQTIDYEVTSSNMGNLITDYTVTVSAAAAPPTPSTPTILSQACNSAVLQKAGNPPSGVTWYWQGINSAGTSTTHNATSNYAVSSSGTYYIRARNASGTWSASSASVQVVLGATGGTTWYQDLDGDSLGDSAVTMVSCAQPTGYVSNNSDQCPTANGNGAANGCPVVSAFGNENYVYSITPQTAMTSLPSNTNTSDFVKSITYFDGLGRAKQSIGIRQSASQRDIVTHIEYNDLGQQQKEYLPYVPTTTGDGQIKSGAKVATESYYNTTAYGNTTNPYSEKTIEASPIGKVFEQGAPGNDWKIGSSFSSKGYSNNSHTIKFEYDTNTDSEVRKYAVTMLVSNNNFTPTLADQGTFAAKSLTKTITKDENWTSGLAHTTEEFKNKKGQVVLKRTYGKVGTGTTIETYDTFYVYDDFGNLTYVIPPKAEGQAGLPTTTEMSELCYQYKYDYRNRLVEKKIPGKGWEYIVYDNLDRPVLTQDANLKTQNKWLFTKYDALGRVIYTGKYSSSSSRTSLQNTFKAKSATSNYETKEGSSGSLGIYYSNVDFPNTGLEVLTVNYYDDYVFNRAGLSAPSSMGTVYGKTITSNAKGLATGSKVRVMDTNDWITTVTYYDEKAQPIYVYSHNTMHTTTDIVQSKLDFTGKVLETKSTHTRSNGNHSTQNIRDVFTYDHAGRLLTQTQYLNGATTGETIVDNRYDELGQLKKKHVGGLGTPAGYTSKTSDLTVNGNNITKTSNDADWNGSLVTVGKIQGDGYVAFSPAQNGKYFMAGLSDNNTTTQYSDIDYAVYIHDTIVFIYESGVSRGSVGSYVAGDVFKVEREGTTVYYKQNGQTIYTSTISSTGALMGDISMYHSNATINNFHIVSNSKGLQTVDYTYNVRGWLQSINQDTNNDNDLFNFGIKYNNPTSGIALYNGNISQTSWSTLSADTSTKTYTYSYDALNRIKTAVDNTGKFNLHLVTYDKNGNISYLYRKGPKVANPDINIASHWGMMDNLVYNYNGNQLTKVMEFAEKDYGFKDGTNTGNDYTYDANGNMLTDQNKGITGISYNHLNLPTQVTINGQTISYTYDAAGTKLRKVVNGTTTDYAGNYIYNNNNLQFFNTPEGYFNVTSTSSLVQGDYVYQYKDHLGNVRLSYSDTNNDGAITPGTEIIEESNYYPFGLKHKGYNDVISSNGNASAQKFKFNHRELNEELGLNIYDFGARNYDPYLGKWFVIDPLADKMRSNSPYNYAFNNPILFIDPDGRFPIIIHVRSFAPFKKFGPGKFWKGDSRGFSLSRDVTSRIAQQSRYETTTGKFSHQAIGSISASSYGAFAYSDAYVDNYSSGNNLNTHLYGNNDAVIPPGIFSLTPIDAGLTPDIDLHTNLDIDVEETEGGNHLIKISGEISGDRFPNAESFVEDANGNRVFLGIFVTKFGPQEGPTNALLGDRNVPMMGINVNILADKNGIFTGVKVGDETISIDEWNKSYSGPMSVDEFKEKYSEYYYLLMRKINNNNN